mgnify:FL=1
MLDNVLRLNRMGFCMACSNFVNKPTIISEWCLQILCMFIVSQSAKINKKDKRAHTTRKQCFVEITGNSSHNNTLLVILRFEITQKIG